MLKALFIHVFIFNASKLNKLIQEIQMQFKRKKKFETHY